MAKGFKHGGGGLPLNFKVVGGTTAPGNPKENTIWVNTDVKITGWIFSAVEPETPAEGVVWFFTSTVSNVEFNALKKNGIQVYPISAKQYVSGAGVEVTAKSYQGGAWVDWFVWDGTLFPESPGIVQITGGWVNDPNVIFADRTNTASCSMTEDAITIVAPGGSKSTNLATVNYIDMTGYSHLKFNVTAMSSSFDASGMIYVDGQINHADAASATVFTTAGEKSIAVPSGGGEFRVAFGLSTSSAQRSFTVSEVRLVK